MACLWRARLRILKAIPIFIDVPVAAFFACHPVVSLGKQGPEAVIGHGVAGASEADCRKVMEDRKVRGVTRYHVITPDRKYVFDDIA